MPAHFNRVGNSLEPSEMTCVKRVRPMLVFMAVLGYTLEARAANDIPWYKDLKQASAAAQKADLPMFIDFWADWCTPCRLMDSKVYTSPKVIELFRRKIIAVRLNFDLQPELARQFNVEALPHLVFTNSHGTSLVYHRGFLEAQDLVNVVDAIPPLADINNLDRRLQQNRDNVSDLVAMARALRTSGFFEASSTFYDRIVKSGGNTDGALRESVFYEMALNSLELRTGKQAVALLEQCMKEFPRTVRKPELLLALGRAYIMSGMSGKAVHSLRLIISEYPESAAAIQARALLKSL